jgi:ABC-type branched-subunit amino acid transport system substrate-binding protein
VVEPVVREVFTLHADYWDEVGALVKLAVEDLKIKDIGFYYQDDALGTAGRGGFGVAMQARGLKTAATGTYKRTEMEQAADASELLKVKPKAVLCFGLYPACKALKEKLSQANYHPVYLSASPLSTFFEHDLWAKETIYNASILPLTTDSSIEIVRKYQEDLKAAGKSFIPTNQLVGYIDAVVMVEALKRAGQNPTRESFIKAFEEMADFDVGGIKFSFSPTKHKAMSTIWIHKSDGKQWVRHAR